MVYMNNVNKKDFIFYDLKSKKKSRKISTIFPQWSDNENIVVFCPHDDDGLLGAAYALLAAKSFGAEVFITILCNGSCGYSHPNDKNMIVKRRIKESSNAYEELGFEDKHIIRFDIDDFCLGAYKEWILPGGLKGVLEPVIRMLREKKITRIIGPNDYREHPDHLAASQIASYIGPQAGDNIVADWGNPSRIRSYLKYSVWAEFDPLEPSNVAVKVKWVIEESVRHAVEKFESQKLVIKDLFNMRNERKIGKYAIEIYRIYDPRPKLDLNPLKKIVQNIDKKRKPTLVN